MIIIGSELLQSHEIIKINVTKPSHFDDIEFGMLWSNYRRGTFNLIGLIRLSGSYRIFIQGHRVYGVTADKYLWVVVHELKAFVMAEMCDCLWMLYPVVRSRMRVRLERETGFGPATACLEGRNSTTELLPRR